MRGERITEFRASLRCKNGSTRSVQLRATGFWKDDKFQFARCFCRDLTDNIRLEAELKRKLDELAEMDRRKSEFLAMLGHELRNPLSALSNALETTKFGELHRDRALEIARRQSDQLGRLVDDLLEVARITSGRITLRKEQIHLRNIVECALEETRSLVEPRHQQVNVLSSVEAETQLIDGDPIRLQQVVANLVSNATKFTPPGGRIEIMIHREGARIVLRVHDSGIGISEAILPHIFEPFTQAENSLERAHGGLGLGLTLVKRLTEMHGGRVEAHSEGLGKGSEFAISLPVIAEEPSQDGSPDSAATDARKYAQVLIVEDNADAAESLSMLLEAFGHDVTMASNGHAAIEIVKARKFDLAILDIGLPGIDGYQIARIMRELPNCEKTILAALTGYGQEEDRKRAMEAGFDHHFMKPLNMERLQKLLAQITG
jgi:signal transduction histidine kinase